MQHKNDYGDRLGPAEPTPDDTDATPVDELSEEQMRRKISHFMFRVDGQRVSGAFLASEEGGLQGEDVRRVYSLWPQYSTTVSDPAGNIRRVYRIPGRVKLEPRRLLLRSQRDSWAGPHRENKRTEFAYRRAEADEIAKLWGEDSPEARTARRNALRALHLLINTPPRRGFRPLGPAEDRRYRRLINA